MLIFIQKSELPEDKIDKLIEALVGFLPHIGDTIHLVGEIQSCITFGTPAPFSKLDEPTRRFFELTADRIGIKRGAMIFAEGTII